MRKASKPKIEVEIRALVDDFKSVKKKLEKQGAEFKGATYIRDIYFCKTNHKCIADVEMNDVGSYSLRLRESKKQKNSASVNTLNIKIITREGDHNAWQEHEVEINDFAEMMDVLLALDFKVFFKLEKTRHHYELKNKSIFLEDIKDFGCGIEIEIMTTPKNAKKSKEQILKLLKDLGIKKEQIVPKSITNMVMKQRAVF